MRSLRVPESQEASHSGWLAVTPPVVCEPVEVQEEGHRLGPAVEDFPTVDVTHREHTAPYPLDAESLKFEGLVWFLTRLWC